GRVFTVPAPLTNRSRDQWLSGKATDAAAVESRGNLGRTRLDGVPERARPPPSGDGCGAPYSLAALTKAIGAARAPPLGALRARPRAGARVCRPRARARRCSRARSPRRGARSRRGTATR